MRACAYVRVNAWARVYVWVSRNYTILLVIWKVDLSNIFLKKIMSLFSRFFTLCRDFHPYTYRGM